MKNSLLFTTVVSITTLLFAVSCGTDDNDDHNDVPVGIQLTLNGEMLVTQDNGAVTYATGDEIEIPENDIVGPVEISFIAEDGDIFTPEGIEYSLDYLNSNDSVISVDHPVGGSEWRFNLTGLSAGNATISFSLLHSGHSDFESLPINFSVTSGEAAAE